MTPPDPSARRLYRRGDVLAWGLYDFANSAFATTILAVVFNVYFVKVVCAGGVRLKGLFIPGESLWGYLISLSTLLVFFLGPLLGAVADHSGSKKKFLFFFCALGVLFTGLLANAREGTAATTSLCFILANVGFAAGNVFYNALLQDLSTPQTIGRISGLGWAMGYVGGGLLLALNLAFIRKPELFAIPSADHMPVRVSILSVSVWWALFALPLFAAVREKAGRNFAPIIERLRAGWRDVLDTFREIRRHREIFKYFLAYFLYNEGIETLIVMASIFGAKELGMSESNLILCFLMIQFVAFAGALAFGELSDRVGHKRAIAASLWIYVAVALWAFRMQTAREFWYLGAVVGLVLGGSQSVSRSLLGLMNPKEKNAQFFGFFGLVGKFSSVTGPLIFALLSQNVSIRAAVGSLAFFFLAGLVLLHFVKEPEAAKAALTP